MDVDTVGGSVAVARWRKDAGPGQPGQPELLCVLVSTTPRDARTHGGRGPWDGRLPGQGVVPPRGNVVEDVVLDEALDEVAVVVEHDNLGPQPLAQQR